MSKIRIKIDIENSEGKLSSEVDAILHDNKLKYKEEDNTIVVFSYEDNTLIRENNELRMEYKFNNSNKTQGNVYVKELNKKINLDIKTTKLKINDNNIDVSFIIEENKFNYRVEVIK